MFFPLLQSAAVLQKLADQVSKKNETVTEGEVDALEKGLQTVLNSFMQLAGFKYAHSGTIKLLREMPIDKDQVSSLQAKMP